MTWHYRVRRHPDGSLALHEVYCDEAGQPNGYTEQAASFGADADEGLDGIVMALERALCDTKERSVLATSDFKDVANTR